MKLLLLATFVALCSASALVRTRTITVGDDGSILIANSFSGRRVEISKNIGLNGQKTVEINVSGPNIPSRTIEINEGVQTDSQVGDEAVREKRSFSKSFSKSVQGQGDVLTLILKDYQGPVTDSQWDKLLTKIQTAVYQGLVIPQIYDLLVGLDFVENNYIWQAIQQGQRVFGQGQQLYGRGVYQGQIPSQYSNDLSDYYYTPLGRTQYLQPSTRYFNPLLERSYLNDLLVNQQYNGQVPSAVTNQVYQNVPYLPLRYYQRQSLLNNLLNTQQQPLSQSGVLGQQQLPYTQQVDILGQLPQQAGIVAERQQFPLVYGQQGQNFDTLRQQVLPFQQEQQGFLERQVPLAQIQQQIPSVFGRQQLVSPQQQQQVWGQQDVLQQQIPSTQRQQVLGQQGIIGQQELLRQVPYSQGQQFYGQPQQVYGQGQQLYGQGQQTYGQRQQVGILGQQVPYNQGFSGLFSYLNNQPLYQSRTSQQPIGVQSYLNNYQVPQVVY